MINPFKEVKWQPDTRERRKFATSLMIGFPALALVFLAIGWIARGSWDANIRFSVWFATAGAAAGLLCWLLPQIARPFYVVWYFLACCFGLVVSNILLGAFYYLVFTPTGILRRLVGKSPLVKRFDRRATTYWTDVPEGPELPRYYRQF